jgi:UDP-N-acetylmuramate--alanine ligase
MGAILFEGHRAENVEGAEVVVTSSAIQRGNPEVAEARRRHIPVVQRAEMLAELMRLKYGIAVAGMHGKTTTTSMVGAVLQGAELDPTIIVGGRVDSLGSNARHGKSHYLVAEADESDRSFLKLSPIVAVVTNIDREHLDTYRDLDDIEQTFLDFMDRVPFYGAVVICNDDDRLRDLLPNVQRRVITYGTREDSDFRARIPISGSPRWIAVFRMGDPPPALPWRFAGNRWANSCCTYPARTMCSMPRPRSRSGLAWRSLLTRFARPWAPSAALTGASSYAAVPRG